MDVNESEPWQAAHALAVLAVDVLADEVRRLRAENDELRALVRDGM